MKLKQLLIAMGALAVLPFAQSAMAHEGVELKHAEVDVTSQEQIRRGLTVFTDVCMGCHSATYVTYKGLMDYPEISLTREEVDDLREDHAMTEGLRTELSAEDAAASYGKVPPDLSLITAARHGGPNYVYSVLTGFEHDPDGRIPDGSFNEYFKGNRIAMPDPLSWLDHDEADTAQLEQDAQDVAAFLAFIADPHQNQRRVIGCWVMGFLLLLTLVLWRLKVEVWKDVKKH